MRSARTPPRRRGAALALTAASFLAFAGCATKTRITSQPEGAMVYVDGRPLGNSPVVLTTRSGIPTVYNIAIEKPGYKKIDAQLTSAYRADLSLVLLLVIFPYFFSARLEDNEEFVMVPASPTPSTPAPAPGGGS